MLTQIQAPEDVPGEEVAPGEVPVQPVKKRRSKGLTAAEFYERIAIGLQGVEGKRGIATLGPSGSLNQMRWRSVFAVDLLVRDSAGVKPAYFTPAAYACTVRTSMDRTQENVVALGGFWLDIEGVVGKAGGGYDGVDACIKALFTCVGPDFSPCVVVSTTNGIHAYWTVNRALSPAEWLPRAKALGAWVVGKGLSTDPSCTADSARLMRAPGSIHQKTGKEVAALELREAPYTLEEFDAAIGYVPGASDAAITTASGLGEAPDYLKDKAEAVNGGVTVYKPFSAVRVAQQCGAFGKGCEREGEATPYPVWLLVLGTAKASIEGRDFAHQVSCRHPDYDEAETDAKLDSLTGGPATCETWGGAYGKVAPCEGCAWRGRVSSPVALGIITDVTPVSEVPEDERGDIPPEIAEINKRFALVRLGGKVVVADKAAPQVGVLGEYPGLDFIEVSAFKSMMRGKLAPLTNPAAKAQPVIDWWLHHEWRDEYQGCAFAPGIELGPAIFNTWRGFALQPAEGSVQPWLDVLAALIPDEALRLYALRWFAWKIQNPGGVPGTVLILKGRKGAGKNALLAPLMVLWGVHALLVADPDQIAGRFTIHLLDKAFVVLDEAVFIGDRRQADRIKARITVDELSYEAKGCTPVRGVNRTAYVMLSNHAHVWEATTDERRAFIVEVGTALCGNEGFWVQYFAWFKSGGAAALLAYLQGVDVSAFNPRNLPKNDALREQIALTALQDRAVSWWHDVLTEGAVSLPSGLPIQLRDDANEVPSRKLQESYEAATRGRFDSPWSEVAKRLRGWCGGDFGVVSRREGAARVRAYILPGLGFMRAQFEAATGIPIECESTIEMVQGGTGGTSTNSAALNPSCTGAHAVRLQ